MDELPANRSDDLILRLFAIARGLEDEGQLNLAKIFRAAAMGGIHLASRDRPRQGAGLEEAMRKMADELAAHGYASESLTGAMMSAVESLERREMPMLSEVPHPLVCYQCGEVMIEDRPPDQCPSCRARRHSLQEIPPIYLFQQFLNRGQVDALLEDNLREIERIVEGVDEQRADEGPWPMREILSHLAGAQDLMFGRARRMVEEDDPSLGSVQPSTVGASEERNLEYILEQFHATRMALLGWFRSLSEVELARTGQHPEWGPFTVLSQVSYMVQHEQLHLAELEARREGR